MNKTAQQKILEHVDPSDFAWAVPIMRAGYAGRGLAYLVVAGVSLWSILQGGQAEGTKAAMQSLNGMVGAMIVGLIAAGMFAYAIWRAVDSIWDLEAYGTSAKGILARLGMFVTGGIHAGIGVLAVTALGAASSGSGGKEMLDRILQSPAGVWAVGLVGMVTVATGFYYFYKAITQSYREHLQGNHFTLHWNPVLRIGLAAQGIGIIIIGGLIAYAALSANASEAGGLGSAFDWLGDQAYGRILVAALCVGLLGFSLFCFVNAAYRIVPKASDRSVQSLSAKVKELAA
jgi:hypothetical protein